MRSNRNKRDYLWYFLIFLIIISIFFSALQDRTRHGYSDFVNNFVSFSYWAWFFTWWSCWVALLTIIWAVYKLFNSKVENYKSQLFDLKIVVGNITSGVIFNVGWILFGLTRGTKRQIKLVSPPHHSLTKKIVSPLPFTAQQTWVIYNVILHTIIPLLVLYLFWKFSKADLLEKKMKKILGLSILNPAIYCFYVIMHAKIIGKSNYPKVDKISKLPSLDPAEFPADYPYTFFYRWMGKPARENDSYYNKYGNSLLSRILWIIGISILIFLLFSILTYCLIKWKKRQAENLTNFKKRNHLSAGE